METSHTSHGTTVKLLAIIGFFSILALFVWLLVQGLRYFPTAVTSLASIAETVSNYNGDRELILTLDRSIVNSGETIILTWTEMGPGTYTFTHTCEDATILAVRTSEDSLRELSCNDTLSLPEEALGLFLRPETYTQRFSEVAFTVTFIPEDGKLKDTHVAKGALTVINATVPTNPRVALEETPVDTVSTPEPAPSVVELPVRTPETKPVPVSPSKPALPSSPSAVRPTQIASPIVAIVPKSYENGFTDLKIAYQGVGVMDDGVFVPKATFTKDDRVALRFEVKNIGTKVSGDWTYALSLPGNLSYVSEKQSPLMPNERAMLTASFVLEGEKGKSTTVEGRVATPNDTLTTNNSFEWSVGISN